MYKIKLFPCMLLLSLLAACGTQERISKLATTDITIFSINDFHGNLQADKPVPYMAPSDEHGHSHPADATLTPSGGYAYLATVLKQRRALTSASILVGAGDLIGASPIGAAILRDEPVFEALNQLGLSVTSVGNHEFDQGGEVLKSKIKGECPEQTCAFPGFRGAQYDYIAANVLSRSENANDKQAWLKPYVIRQVGDVKVAFIGAVTADTPNLVAGDGVKQLHFEDEATAINRYVPEIQRQGVAAIVVLIHEGAYYKGAANDPTYECKGLQGPIIDIVKRLDKSISLVVSGHTHQGYTCKIDGRMLVQARSYGAYLTETTLTIDRSRNQVINAVAINYLVEQHKLLVDPVAQQLVEQVANLTNTVRNRPIAAINAQLTRKSAVGGFDSSLGNVIADAQLSFARTVGGADISFINSGSIRNDLPAAQHSPNVAVTYGDIYAVQPFGNSLVSMSLSGAQIVEVLKQQWQGRAADDPKKLFVSQGLSYLWSQSAPPEQRVQQLAVNGKPIDLARQYKVIVNNFLADGGDGFTVFKQGSERQIIGRDLVALEAYLRQPGLALPASKKDRVGRMD